MSIQDIYIPPEDSLGRVMWEGRLEPTQKVIDAVYERLKKDYADKRMLWDLTLIKSWGDMPATEKQRALVKRIAPLFDSDKLTKFEANQLLSRKFAPEAATEKQIYFLLQKGYNTHGLTKQEASRLIAKIKGN